MEHISPTSSTDSQASIEIGDFIFCHHGREVCQDCSADFREDNAFTAGIDPTGERESINVDFSLTKEGVPQCKKHRSTACTSCHSFKKQIAKLNKEASKSASKRKGSTSNFV